MKTQPVFKPRLIPDSGRLRRTPSTHSIFDSGPLPGTACRKFHIAVVTASCGTTDHNMTWIFATFHRLTQNAARLWLTDLILFDVAGRAADALRGITLLFG